VSADNRMFTKSAKDKSKGSNPLGEVPMPRTIQHTGRERFRFVDGELKRANEAITDLEARVARLGAIIAESEVNQRNLQQRSRPMAVWRWPSFLRAGPIPIPILPRSSP
jgi:hypothetical protein